MSKRPREHPEGPIVPCDHCRSSKIRCDHLQPCHNCISRGRQCTYPIPDESGRVRRFHKRSRNGCSKCKTRKVRCDEGKPACGGCVRMAMVDQCMYPTAGEASPAQFTDYDTFISSITATPVGSPIPPFSASRQIASSSSIGRNYGNNNQNENYCPTPGFEAIVELSTNAEPISAPSMPSRSLTSDLLAAFTAPATPSAQEITSASNSMFSMPLQSGLSNDSVKHVDLPFAGLLNTATLANSPIEEIITETQDLVPFPQNQQAYLTQTWPLWTQSTALIAPLHQPDVLAAYFPSLEQRHQYRHFFTETVKSLVVVPTSPATNPWLHRLSALALGSASGHDPTHDALRYAILSLATFDIGFRIHNSLADRNENVMYATSFDQRKTALQLVRLGRELGSDKARDDLILGTMLALSFRDRLAGSELWEEPLKIAAEVVESYGGTAAFIAQNPTPTRRYLVEQMAAVEILALLAVFTPPRLVSWDIPWLDVDQKDEPNDHLHVVLGWDRETYKIGSRVVVIADEYRRIMVLRDGNAKQAYPAVRAAINARMLSLRHQCDDVLASAQRNRTILMMTPVPAQVSLLALSFQLCLELLIQLIVLGSEKMMVVEAQSKVVAILEIADEAMSRGLYAGLLLPLTWAAACAIGPNYARADHLIEVLQHHYHLEHGFMKRLVDFDWKEFEGIAFDDWEDFLKSRKIYVPLF